MVASVCFFLMCVSNAPVWRVGHPTRIEPPLSLPQIRFFFGGWRPRNSRKERKRTDFGELLMHESTSFHIWVYPTLGPVHAFLWGFRARHFFLLIKNDDAWCWVGKWSGWYRLKKKFPHHPRLKVGRNKDVGLFHASHPLPIRQHKPPTHPKHKERSIITHADFILHISMGIFVLFLFFTFSLLFPLVPHSSPNHRASALASFCQHAPVAKAHI